MGYRNRLLTRRISADLPYSDTSVAHDGIRVHNGKPVHYPFQPKRLQIRSLLVLNKLRICYQRIVSQKYVPCQCVYMAQSHAMLMLS